MATLNTSRTVLTTKDNKKDDLYIANATTDFSSGSYAKRHKWRRVRHPKTVKDYRRKHTIIATLSVKKGSKFTDPDAQFPRGGALACARGLLFSPSSQDIHTLYKKAIIIQSHLSTNRGSYILNHPLTPISGVRLQCTVRGTDAQTYCDQTQPSSL